MLDHETLQCSMESLAYLQGDVCVRKLVSLVGVVRSLTGGRELRIMGVV